MSPCFELQAHVRIRKPHRVPVLVSLLAVLVLLSASSLHAGDRKGGSNASRGAVAICYPVAGTGRILGQGACTPLGSLSPLFEGDTVIVQAGEVGVLDMRSGQRHQLKPAVPFIVKRIKERVEESHWDRLREALMAMAHPDYRRKGAFVRSGESCLWPDDVRFAQDVPIRFQWCGVRPEPRTLQIILDGRDTTRIALDAEAIAMSALEWPAQLPVRAGRVRWTLLAADGQRLDERNKRFEILTTAAADSLRAFYTGTARADAFGPEGALGAALLAAEKRLYLW
jgi:hypothetical protein